LGTLGPTERGGLSKQEALARVVNDIVHGIVEDIQSLERCGQEMWGTAVRNHGGKLGKAHAALSRAKSDEAKSTMATELAKLDLILYECKRGATTPQSLAGQVGDTFQSPLPVPPRPPPASKRESRRMSALSAEGTAGAVSFRASTFRTVRTMAVQRQEQWGGKQRTEHGNCIRHI
jgi:hypothetical protein